MLSTTTDFKPGSTVTRMVRHPQQGLVHEFGEVKARLSDGRVLIETKQLGQSTGFETFAPAHGFGWRLCG